MNDMKLEDYRDIYSDFYKDAMGFRPRHVDTSDWTVEQFEEEFNHLQLVCDENGEAEILRQEESKAVFESKVSELIESGAGDRYTAISWLKEAENAVGETTGYFEYCMDLPYGYLKEVA